MVFRYWTYLHLPGNLQHPSTSTKALVSVIGQTSFYHLTCSALIGSNVTPFSIIGQTCICQVTCNTTITRYFVTVFRYWSEVYLLANIKLADISSLFKVGIRH